MAGETTHALRGDYKNIAADYTVEQDYSSYTQAEQMLWKRLFTRQSSLLPNYACDEFTEILSALNFGDGIPKFADINIKLAKTTGWQIVAVPTLEPFTNKSTVLETRDFRKVGKPIPTCKKSFPKLLS